MLLVVVEEVRLKERWRLMEDDIVKVVPSTMVCQDICTTIRFPEAVLNLPLL
ncbi:uncharacterized protein G2W53_043812 [Senna tora]|uniref:Uncharacterized protein n=1 Tax=Senna tora TaxID=362788 RepID=A0A834SJR5_9FABA|nr:uncharacterized protein G2W53_043812 [Senna tora]